MPLFSVPGQAATGYIDGLFRSDAGDGTLGLPDYSLVPYTYAPLLGPVDGDPQWVLDQFRQGSYAAFKGAADGLGALRTTSGSYAVEYVLQSSGVKSASPDGSRAPDYTWGPRDFALAVRHPGTTSWSPSNTRAYLAFSGDDKTVGMRLTTSAAEGPWDAEAADAAAIPIGTNVPDPWDGNGHIAYAVCFGGHVLCILDHCIAYTFRAPRAYKRNPDGTVDPAVFANLPATGAFGGFDTRNERNYYYGWLALQAASGDLFYYDMSPTAVQVPPATTYTPTTLASGETWTLTGTATASKNGLQLAASSTALFSVQAPHGLICTRWGVCQAQAGLVFRRVDASNYHIVTSTGVSRVTNGSTFTSATFATSIKADDHVLVQNFPSNYVVFVNGKLAASTTNVVQGQTAATVGFLNPAGGTSQWRYIAHQPYPPNPVLPTS